MPEPWWDDGTKAASGSTGRNDQEVVWSVQCVVGAVALVADDRSLADGCPLATLDVGVFEHIAPDVGLGPVCCVKVLAELRWNNDDIVARPDRLVPHVGLDLGDEGVQDLFGFRRPFVHDLAGRHGGQRRDR